MLFALRQSATRLGRLLAPLLLLSWMSLLCGNCFALADQAAAMDHEHHGMPMDHGSTEDGGHACCDHPEPCLGTDCQHVLERPALKAEPGAGLSLPAMAALTEMEPHWPAAPPPPGPPLRGDFVTVSPPPLYLRHCVFRI